MRKMLGSSIAVFVLFVAAFLAPPSSNASRYRKYKPPPPMATLTVTVLKA